MEALRMRYEARWVNGYWGVFDTEEYRTVQITFGPKGEWVMTQAEACELAIQANLGENERMQRRRQ